MSPPERPPADASGATGPLRRHTLVMGGLTLFVALTLGAIAALGLPWWYGAVFLVALPAWYVALRTVASAQRKTFLRQSAALLDKRADRFRAPTADDVGGLARWWFPPHALQADIAQLYLERRRTAEAGRAFAMAAAVAPVGPRAALAREAFRCHRLERQQLFAPDALEPVLRALAESPDATAEEHAALAWLLIEHHNDPAAAEGHLRQALALTDSPARRFRILCQLAVAVTLDGRYGAGDGYLAEAHAEMPSGDPGFQAYYARVAARLERTKKFVGDMDAVIHLRALIEGPADLATPSPLPESPDDDA